MLAFCVRNWANMRVSAFEQLLYLGREVIIKNKNKIYLLIVLSDLQTRG